MRQFFLPAGSGNPLHKLAAFVVTAIAVVLGLMFSLVLLVGIAIIGVVALVYVWWQTRDLRKQVREQQDGTLFREEVMKGEVIEGEVIRVTEPQAGSKGDISPRG